jgi:hypothetical protein
MQDACGLNFVRSPSQMLQHLFNIVPSCQSMFDGSVQCLPQNLSIPFSPQWPLQVPLTMPHYYKSWFLKMFKLIILSVFTNGHVHLTKGQGFE